MQASRRILQVICAMVFVVGLVTAVNAQSANSPPAPEQEFLDAIKKGNAVRVNELIKQNPSLIKATTKNGTTAILVAVYTGHDEIAESLAATGVELNIFEAAAMSRLDRVQELLKKNPELVKAYSPDGWTPLHLSFGNLEVVKLLLDRGADINAVSRNRFGATPLQGAAAFKNVEMATLLIERGANVNCRGEGGGTPLHEAAGNGQIKFAKLLLDHAANMNAKDDKGKTPLTIALANKQTEMAEFLRSKNATQ